jgi:hypothetical protein
MESISTRDFKKLRYQLRNLRGSAPTLKKSTKWYERLHDRVMFFAKYVGIPGVIIAAVGPVGKLGQEWIEHHNKKFIQTTYVDYATVLLNQGSIERASKLLGALEAQKDFDSRLQYYKAKIVIAMAVQQARNYSEAYDNAKILTTIQETKDIFFPSMEGVDELVELKMALVDIDTAQQRYREARNALDEMGSQKLLAKSRLLKSNVDYRYGVLDVLQFQLPSAVMHLSASRQEAKQTNQNLLAANSAFQLAKARQFAAQEDAALDLYTSAAQEYDSLGEQFGLLRTYNNIAMIYQDKQDSEKARKYYNMEQELARRVGDDLGYARSTLNIAVIEKIQGNYDASIRLAIEALGRFKQQNALNGIHGAAILLSNDYFYLEKFPDALAYAKQAFASATDQRDLRAIAAACGSMSNVYSKLGDNQEIVFSSLCTIMMIKYLDYQKLPKSEFDYQYFRRSIAAVRQTIASDQYNQLLASAEKRVGDIALELNLGKDLLYAEVAGLQSPSRKPE